MAMIDDAKCAQPARNAATTRQSILDAARRQFARDSYENVGVRDIAGEVGKVREKEGKRKRDADGGFVARALPTRWAW